MGTNKSCETCEYMSKKEYSLENDKSDDWLSCDLIYVETRNAVDLNGFYCGWYKKSKESDGTSKNN
jgi:hypothetical protein